MGAGVDQNKGKRKTSLSEINVTPFVDVMLVLLVIFMVTAPLKFNGLPVNLPQAAAGSMEQKQEPIVLSITKDKEIYVTVEGNIINLTFEGLQDGLKEIFKNRSQKELSVMADEELNYGFAVKVMTMARRAGIFKVQIVTQPPARSSGKK